MKTSLLTVAPCPVALIRTADEPLTGIRVRSSVDYVRVRPGVYCRRIEWAALAPWERYLARVHAYALAHPDAIFCLESAAVLLGMPIFDEPRDIHVLDLVGGRSHRRGDVCIHSSAEPAALRFGELVTTDIPDTALDLVRVLPPAFGLAVADAALRLRRDMTGAILLEKAAEQSARRGVARLRWVLPRADAQAESVGESVSRAVIEWSGFPQPECQVEFHAEGFTDRVDFFWRRYRAIGESDGWGKYGLSGRDPIRALRDEKTREDRLRRQVDGFGRWDWSDTLRIEPLQRKVASAGVPQLHPVRTAMLATLSRNPRSSRA